MKKILSLLLIIGAVFSFVACTQKADIQTTNIATEEADETAEPINTSTPEPKTIEVPQVTRILPMDLFADEYNLFYEVKFPESYSVYCGEYVSHGDLQLYYLHLTTTDSAEDVVRYISNLLGDSTEQSIQQNIDNLQNTDLANILGTEVDAGLDADCEIAPMEDGEWAYENAEGYTISLVMKIESDDAKKYNDLLLANINYNVLGVTANYFDAMDYTMAGIKVNSYRNNTEVHLGYYMDNAKDVWDMMAKDLPDNYSEEYSVFSFPYGELSTEFREDLNGGFIHIFQRLQSYDGCIMDYVPTDNYANFGFMDFREECANVKYTDEDNGIEVFVFKSEWGEPEWEDQREAILFAKDIGQDSFIVKYYPHEDRYSIRVNYGDESAEYEYFPVEDRYVNEFGGDDMTDVINIACKLFDKPGEDSILQDAWVKFEQYIEDAFGMNPAELYALGW